jgi:hypothetical protein
MMLSSIQNMLSDIERNTHEGAFLIPFFFPFFIICLDSKRNIIEDTGLHEVFKHHTFVGCINNRLALIQHRTKLYLCDISLLRFAFFKKEFFLK